MRVGYPLRVGPSQQTVRMVARLSLKSHSIYRKILNRNEGNYTLSRFLATSHISIVARTGKGNEQASSDEGVWQRPKRQR